MKDTSTVIFNRVDETITLDVNRTVAVNVGPSSEQRYYTVTMLLALADMWDLLDEPGKALFWRKAAEGAGWRPEFDFKKEVD